MVSVSSVPSFLIAGELIISSKGSNKGSSVPKISYEYGSNLGVLAPETKYKSISLSSGTLISLENKSPASLE